MYCSVMLYLIFCDQLSASVNLVASHSCTDEYISTILLTALRLLSMVNNTLFRKRVVFYCQRIFT